MSKYNWDEKHIITFPEEKVALSTKDLHVYYGKNESIKASICNRKKQNQRP